MNGITLRVHIDSFHDTSERNVTLRHTTIVFLRVVAGLFALALNAGGSMGVDALLCVFIGMSVLTTTWRERGGDMRNAGTRCIGRKTV